MGMFDRIEVEVPLPDGWDPKTDGADHGELQTKDLECLLLDYRITAEGRLEVMAVRWEPVEGRDEFGPVLRRVEEGWREWHERDGRRFSGRINFYGSERARRWHEYTATFEDGQLREIAVDEEMVRRLNERLGPT
jgi:hypothetical protein